MGSPKDNITGMRLEALGTVTNAPHGDGSKGYSFIEIEDGSTVYCSPAVTKTAGVNVADVGSSARVVYVQMRDKRLCAVRVNVLRGPDGSDQEIADALTRVDEAIDVLDEAVDTARAILRSRGCVFPEEPVYHPDG